MSRHEDRTLRPRLEEAAGSLREPVRPMPDSLRSRLLAIPTHEPQSRPQSEPRSESEADEIDRLYGVALSATRPADRDADLDAESLGTTPIRAAVVRVLAAVFHDARSVHPLPERLAEGLRALRRPARPAWRTRWITEPRWAAAACWLLAFALTLGTGDAVAGLLEAPRKLQATSTSWNVGWASNWASSWTRRADDRAEDAWTATRDGLATGYGLVRSRAVALGLQAEAWSGRAVRDVETGWTYLTQTFAPTYETNPGDTSPEEARDDR